MGLTSIKCSPRWRIFAARYLPYLAEGSFKGSCKGLYGLKPDVVAGIAVMGFRIAQTYDKFHDGATETGAKKDGLQMKAVQFYEM